MIEYEDECVDCPPEIGCLGTACPRMHVPHYYCDKCKEEIDPDEIYRVDDEDLCCECLKEMFKFSPEEINYGND